MSGWTGQGSGNQSQFDVNRCRLLRPANVLPNGRAELLCAYDYGVESRTFMQVFGDEGYGSWRAASSQTNEFDLDRCRGVQLGDVTRNGLGDLICAYNYMAAMRRAPLCSGRPVTAWPCR